MLQIRYPWPRRPGCVTAAEMLSVRRIPRGSPRPGVPEFRSERTGAPVVASPHQRHRDPAARADPDAGRADRPGPHAAAPGRRVPGPAARRLRALINARRSMSSASPSIAAPRRERPVTVPATADRAQARRRPLPNAVLFGGFAALSGPGDAGCRGAGDPRDVQRHRRRRQRRRGHRGARVRPRARWRIWPMLKQIEGSRPSPRPSRFAARKSSARTRSRRRRTSSRARANW